MLLLLVLDDFTQSEVRDLVVDAVDENVFWFDVTVNDIGFQESFVPIQELHDEAHDFFLLKDLRVLPALFHQLL